MKNAYKIYLEDRKKLENVDKKLVNKSIFNALIYTVVALIPIVLLMLNLGVFFLSNMFLLGGIALVLFNLIILLYFYVYYKTLECYEIKEVNFKYQILFDYLITGVIMSLISIILMVILIPYYIE